MSDRTGLDNRIATLLEGKTIAKMEGFYFGQGFILLMTDGTKIEFDAVNNGYGCDCSPRIDFTVDGVVWEEKI